MIAFLLTAVVIGALMYRGYRFSMGLYARGAMEASSSQVQSVGGETFAVRPLREVEMEERDYGLRYARVGLLIMAIFMVILVLGLVAAIFSVI
ncbi:MAG TPA: hypothetical protein VKX46_19665 [Ktedonobacteraceae bacterium]|jgi:hypothetical protein|nr:hypothetical protein [Ktedonobacteraceae bacterium]